MIGVYCDQLKENMGNDTCNKENPLRLHQRRSHTTALTDE